MDGEGKEIEDDKEGGHDCFGACGRNVKSNGQWIINISSL